eukprot:TRINITY_DN2445_c0_g1_i1.p1 TRINITY_DN2445_c0_g1~~TRINITY_DN2445_c0_g1_i1.p1  ORF type:complete len:225 (-),score=18.70 TRINITY_DN2445_c0_g1_i1:224-898(-)
MSFLKQSKKKLFPLFSRWYHPEGPKRRERLPTLDFGFEKYPESWRKLGRIPVSTDPRDAIFNEPKAVFAIFDMCTRQKKATIDDNIYSDRIANVEPNDVLRFSRVLMLGSRYETIIGRPYIPGAYVDVLVQDQRKDGKVIVFKMKSKNRYRRHKGHRARLTGVKILSIHGIEEMPGEELTHGAHLDLLEASPLIKDGELIRQTMNMSQLQEQKVQQVAQQSSDG